MALKYATRNGLAKQASYERHAQIESLRLVAASAIAAAGQVRDTRLDRLENPVPPPEPDIWLDLFLDLALTPAISAVAGRVIKRITKRVVAARLPYGPVRVVAGTGRTPAGLILNDATVTSLQRAQVEAREVVDSRRERWEELVCGFANEVVDNAQPRALEEWRRTKTTHGELPFEWPISPEQDSPASAVEEAVLRGVARQEFAVGVVFDDYLSQIYNPALTNKQADGLAVFFDNLAATPRVDEGEARRLRLFFEACIWGMMLPQIAKTVERNEQDVNRSTRDEVNFNPSAAKPTTKYNQLLISDELATYLARRLPHPSSPDGLQSFAGRARKSEQREKDAVKQDISQQPWTDNPLAAGAASLRQLSDLEERSQPWKDQHGGDLQSALNVPSEAHADLNRYFRLMTREMNTLVGRLHALRPKVGRLDQPPTRKQPPAGVQPKP